MNEYQNPPASAPPPPPTVPPAVVVPPVVVAPPPVIVERKSPGLAGFLSIFPGLGHIYLGLYQRGFIIGGAFTLLIALTSHGRGGHFFGPLIAFLWFFGIIDAVRQAKAINRGQIAESGFVGEAQIKEIKASGSGALAWGVILVGMGSLWLIDRYFEIDWSFMDEWGAPLAFILLGLILIVGHIRKRRRENEAQVGMPPRSL
ncbi:MAG: hypothetical protein WAU32_05690 [Thermoanaerobaculia bacterium]